MDSLFDPPTAQEAGSYSLILQIGGQMQRAEKQLAPVVVQGPEPASPRPPSVLIAQSQASSCLRGSVKPTSSLQVPSECQPLVPLSPLSSPSLVCVNHMGF